jgi:hypothetical protein
VVRLGVIFFNNLSPLPLFHSFLVQIHSYNTHHHKVRLGVIFFNNLSPLALFHSFLVHIHSYNTYHPKGRLVVIFLNNLSPPASFLIQIHSFPHNHHHVVCYNVTSLTSPIKSTDILTPRFNISLAAILEPVFCTRSRPCSFLYPRYLRYYVGPRTILIILRLGLLVLFFF